MPEGVSRDCGAYFRSSVRSRIRAEFLWAASTDSFDTFEESWPTPFGVLLPCLQPSGEEWLICFPFPLLLLVFLLPSLLMMAGKETVPEPSPLPPDPTPVSQPRDDAIEGWALVQGKRGKWKTRAPLLSTDAEAPRKTRKGGTDAKPSALPAGACYAPVPAGEDVAAREGSTTPPLESLPSKAPNGAPPALLPSGAPVSPEEMAKILNHPRVYAFLHIPVQSASDSILMDMKREYCVEDFRRVVDFLKENQLEVLENKAEDGDQFDVCPVKRQRTEEGHLSMSEASAYRATSALGSVAASSCQAAQRRGWLWPSGTAASPAALSGMTKTAMQIPSNDFIYDTNLIWRFARHIGYQTTRVKISECKDINEIEVLTVKNISQKKCCTSTNVIYTIMCQQCPSAMYIGQTGQSLPERKNGHKSDIRNGNIQ
ncbi:CDK5 regulatory subunit-associated protein 1-like 1 [Chelonia mydas]|uniref:CDK5 regulatory subunit-associated protein 1-like 1 n=1 Tax=Chelonia mydas TaxID=8469 RepID=M7BT83_CHEMY|nr:CDK5 regulatory subunit-associated protein 1-like 1 [Chelonia mydas]